MRTNVEPRDEYAVRVYLRGYQKANYMAETRGDKTILPDFKAFHKEARAKLDAGEYTHDTYLASVNGWLASRGILPVSMGEAQGKRGPTKNQGDVIGEKVLLSPGEHSTQRDKTWNVRCLVCGREFETRARYLNKPCANCLELQKIKDDDKQAEWDMFIEEMEKNRSSHKEAFSNNLSKKALAEIVEFEGKEAEILLSKFEKSVGPDQFLIFKERALEGKSLKAIALDSGITKQAASRREKRAVDAFNRVFRDLASNTLYDAATRTGKDEDELLTLFKGFLTENLYTIFELRSKGVSFEKIAEKLGIEPQEVLRLEMVAVSTLSADFPKLVRKPEEKPSTPAPLKPGSENWSKLALTTIVGDEKPKKTAERRVLSVIEQNLSPSQYKLFSMRCEGVSLVNIAKELGKKKFYIMTYESYIYKKVMKLYIFTPQIFQR